MTQKDYFQNLSEILNDIYKSNNEILDNYKNRIGGNDNTSSGLYNSYYFFNIEVKKALDLVNFYKRLSQ